MKVQLPDCLTKHGRERFFLERHVHFSGGSGLGKDNKIMIQPQRHGQIDAHLGFLQLHHRYHVEFAIPWNRCVHGYGKSVIPAIIIGSYNPNCSIIDLRQEKDGLALKIKLLANKGNMLKEKVQIICCKAGSPLTIQLNAWVLEKDKGTPLLRNGVCSIAVKDSDNDDMSE